MDEEFLVKKIVADPLLSRPFHPPMFSSALPGSFVAVRPVVDNPEHKTYLGILLGTYCPPTLSFDKETGILNIGRGMGNPAIWVPDLNKVVMGYESWWGRINSPEDLKAITNQDIENVWYVQALRALHKGVDDAV